MISELSFQYPTWYILLCCLLGLVFAISLYYKDHKFSEAPSWAKWVMGALRFLSVTAISILLLSPFLKLTTEDIKQPIVVIAEDASQSIAANLSKEQTDGMKQEINDLASQLSTKYEVKRLTIGDEIVLGAVDSFSNKVTNLSRALEFIYDNYGDQNLGAVVLSTDGIYNEGKNPLYSNVKLKSGVFIVAQGDTLVRKDLAVKNVFNNRIAYLGDKFSIQVDVSAQNSAGSSTELTVREVGSSNGPTLSSERITIDKNNFFATKEIILEAKSVGIVRYRVALSDVNGEITKANNYKDIFVEVLDARQKIVLLANGPHPDLSALKSLITVNKNYEIDIHYPGDQGLNLSKYNLVVLHNLPSEKFPLTAELALLNKAKTPRLFVVGAQTSLNALNRVQENIKIVGNSNSLEEIQADLVTNFNGFTTDANRISKLKTFPPLIAPFGQYSNPSGASVLFTQNIKKIGTEYPLLSFIDKQNFKTGVWVGEGIWKWRLFDHLQHGNYDLTTEIINKAIQYISTKEDKRRFRVNPSKNLYKENEQIAFDAQLYNESYEMINEVDVFLTITNEAKKEFKYTFSRANNYYILNVGMLPPGKYTYSSTTNYDGKLYDQSGSFSVQDIQLELYDMTARHNILKALTDKYGGKMVAGGQATSLAASIMDNDKIKPVIYQSTETKSIINFKWLFGLILFLLGLEWFLRRYMGSY